MENIKDVRILITDDEPQLLIMVERLLQRGGFHEIRTASNVQETVACAKEWKPELYILDVSLPDGDGFSLFEELKKMTDVPVLFLSARDEDADRLRGLGLGADDYITKPFLPEELILRISAVLRRTYRDAKPTVESITMGNVTVDMTNCVVTGNGEEKILTAKEFSLLQILNENRGRIVTVDSLCRRVWQDENIGYDNTIMVHIRRLREKVEANPSHPEYILTVRGLGYRMKK